MKYAGAIIALCCAAGLTGAPQAAYAFELESAPPTAFASPFAQQNLFNQESKGYSLAMPLSGNGDDGATISSYGNAIPIPGPGVDLPAPAWAYSPGGRSFGFR